MVTLKVSVTAYDERAHPYYGVFHSEFEGDYTYLADYKEHCVNRLGAISLMRLRDNLGLFNLRRMSQAKITDIVLNVDDVDYSLQWGNDET